MPRGATCGCWGVKNFSVGICDGAPSTACSSLIFVGHGHLKKLRLKLLVWLLFKHSFIWNTRLRQASSQHLFLHSILYSVARLHIKIAINHVREQYSGNYVYKEWFLR